MNILILNLILSTPEKGVIKKRDSISDTMICSFARGFVALGHSVTIVAAEEFRPTGQLPEDVEMVFLPSRMPKVFNPSLLPWPIGLGKYLKVNSSRFQLVISSEAFSIATLIASKYCPEKLVVWQEMAYHQRKMKKMPSKIWHNLVMRHYINKSLVVPRSERARHFIAHYSQHVTNEIVDHGADGQALYPSEESTDSFVIVSQLIPRKNVDKMIDIFARFIATPLYAHYKLHVIGDGGLTDKIKQQIKSLGIDNNVILHGFMTHNQLASYLRNAKALLVNTSMDLNMVTIPESIISGTPVVMNTMPTTASFVSENHLGIAKDGWDESTLVDLINSYDSFHAECIKARDGLTNIGCAKKMLSIFERHSNQPG